MKIVFLSFVLWDAQAFDMLPNITFLTSDNVGAIILDIKC